MMNILITGGCGWTAEGIIHTLHQHGHRITVFDLPDIAPNPLVAPMIAKVVSGDIARFDDIVAAMQGYDAIVHLAVATGEDDYSCTDIPFATNVKGTYNLFEAIRLANPAVRVILTGSAPVHLTDLNGDYPTSAGDDHLYDLTKTLQEFIAEDFCHTYQMNVITLRLGHIVDGRGEVDPQGRPLADLQYCRGGWVCRYDVAGAVNHALRFDQPGYHRFDIIGAIQARDRFDIVRTETELGFRCLVDFKDYS
jgi:nucleoside-diphosphate-sugar epimerase